MENRAYAMGAGVFTLLLIAALTGAVIWLTGGTAAGRRIDLVAPGAVSGLNARAAVRLRGVDVGEVRRIGFDPEDPRKILVRIAVNPDTPLTASTYAQLSYQGVTALAYVELDDDGSSRAPLVGARGSSGVPRIELRPSRLDQLGDSGELLLTEVGETARRVNLLLSDGNLAQLSRTLEHLEDASRKTAVLADSLQPVAKALPDLVTRTDSLLGRTDTLIAHADSAVQQVGPVLTALDDVAHGVQQHMNVLDQIGRDADRVGDASEALQHALVDDALPRFHTVMDDLARNSRSLDRLLASLNDQPQSIVFGRAPAPPDPGEPGFHAQ